jgi:DNA-binding IclR family transcriptional regulator
MSATPNSSVDQVFDVLSVLSATDQPVGVAQLARTLDVPTSTAHRVLITLLEAGYVVRDTTGSKYQLGLGAQELTHALLRRFPVQAASQSFLRRLVAETGDTVVLTGRVGWYGVRVAGVEGWREIHAAPRLGQTALLEDAPGGRAILAFLDDTFLDAYLRWRGRGRATAAVRAIREDVQAIRDEGHVIDRHDDGRVDIAVPVRARERAVAAIAIEAAEHEGSVRADRTRVSRAGAVAADLEKLLRDRPELAIDPFAHLSPAELSPGFDVAAKR